MTPEVAMRMCRACEDGRHWACGMQTWCACDCDPTNPDTYEDRGALEDYDDDPELYPEDDTP